MSLSIEGEEAAEKNIVLAIETAAAGGSLAVLRNGAVIDGWVGQGSGVSRSEDVLVEIKNILEKNSLLKSQIKLIAVSNGPGSFTGARIGAATARGLSKSLGCGISAFTIFEALVTTGSVSESAEKRVAAAISFPGARVCRQRFTVNGERQILSSEKPELLSLSDFAVEAATTEYDELILHELLLRQLSEYDSGVSVGVGKISSAGSNLAAPIGRAAWDFARRNGDRAKDISPLYIQNFRLSS